MTRRGIALALVQSAYSSKMGECICCEWSPRMDSRRWLSRLTGPARSS